MNAQTKIEPATLSSAMALAFAEIEGATKAAAGQVGQQRYRYADLGAVIEAVKPALIKHGLFFTQHCHPSEEGVMVETVLGHAGGEEKSLGRLFVPANKKDAQGFGSALTYARRYALMTAFGVPCEDDDGNAASRTSNGAKANGGALIDDHQWAGLTQMIDDHQWASLTQMIEATGTDTRRFCEYMGVPSLKEIPASRYQSAVDALQAKAKKPAVEA